MTPTSSRPGPRWVLHPTILAGAFVLDIALANKVEPAGFARSLLIAIAAALAVTLVGWAVFRDRWLGGLAALAVVLASISLIPIFFAWRAANEAFGPAAGLGVLGSIVIVAIAVPVAQLVRARRGATLIRGPATSVLNQIATVLVVVTLVVHIGPDLPGTAADVLRVRAPVTVAPPDAELPDIYLLLLDGYPRADVLSRRFGIENAPFLGELRGLGFDVEERSLSNYTFTPLTMVSLFQMKHLEDVEGLAPLVSGPDSGGTQVNALRNALNTAPAFAALRAAGYEIVVTSPGYEHVELRGVADRVLYHGEMNDLERDVFKRTWLLGLVAPLVPGIFSSPPHDRIVHAFDDLEGLADQPRDGPIFAWIHIPAPHLPIVVDAQGDHVVVKPRQFDGEDAAGFDMTDAQFAAAFASEIAYLNDRILRAARVLQAADAGTDPVIIVMSDHGYNSDLTDIQARFAILFAAFTPQAPGLLADGPTPVNVMARVLNRYLGTHFPSSPDRYFLSASGDRILPLTELENPDATDGP